MAILVNGYGLEKHYSGRTLFKGLSFGVNHDEHIGLIGANGAGKSTLLKIIQGEITPDKGTLSRKQGLRIAYLGQDPKFDANLSIMNCLLSGAHDPHDWQAIAQGQELFSKLGFLDDGFAEDMLVSELSGGWRKKAALGRELMRDPELLLLDEPTNHLDVESILWLEGFLAEAPFATLTITHDRLFLNRISNRIWELDKRNVNGLLVVEGDYARYCETKDLQVAAQERRESVLKNTLRRETEWLRKQPRARATKSVSRIDRAHELQDNVANIEKINRVQSVGISFEAADGTPKKLIEAKSITKSYGDRQLFKDLSLRLDRGHRIGLLGKNGCGKSTLIRILLGNEMPDKGTVERSERLKVAYFEQGRQALDPENTVVKTLCPNGDHVSFRGNFVHIRSYLDRFLFSAEQMDSKVGKLSGGEQARLLIARLMLQEANVLVLDEPTNDLDMPTLNVLEDRLRDFDGAIVLVTHDRYFLDQVCDKIVAFHDGEIENFTGVQQWERWIATLDSMPKTAAPAPVVAATPKKKLGYVEQREFDQIESNIAKAEAQLVKLAAQSNDPSIGSDTKKLIALSDEMAKAQKEIDRLYSRWTELENKTK